MDGVRLVEGLALKASTGRKVPHRFDSCTILYEMYCTSSVFGQIEASLRLQTMLETLE